MRSRENSLLAARSNCGEIEYSPRHTALIPIRVCASFPCLSAPSHRVLSPRVMIVCRSPYPLIPRLPEKE